MSQLLWGIDLGGTKIEGVVLPSLNDPTPVHRSRVSTEKEHGYEHILHQIKKLIQHIEKETGKHPDRIGIGTPGVLDPVLLTIKNSNTTALNGMPLQKDLETLLGIPVALANDANCFALAETHWGAVKKSFPDATMVFGIIMGTGVGGGIIHEGKVWAGKQGIAGEWGHNFLDDSGGSCYCGKTGCVETILSGPSLQRYYKSLTGMELTLRDIVCAAEKNDPAALATLERMNHYFGKAVSSVINLLDPDVIVIGGGVGNIDSLYRDGFQALKPWVFNNRVDTALARPVLGDSAGVFGAAALVA